MSDKLTEASSDAQRRAEKIKAIRRSIHSEAEVAPTTYENKTTESERSETIADRIQKAKDKKISTAEDILVELDQAIAFEKAEAARLAAEKEAAEAKADANAVPDISDIINEIEARAQDGLSELADEIVEDFSEVSGNPKGEVLDLTETDTEQQADDFPEVAEIETVIPDKQIYEAPQTEEQTAEEAEHTVVFTPVGRSKESNEPLSVRTGEGSAVREASEAERAVVPPLQKAEEQSEDVKTNKKKKKKKKSFKERFLGLFPQKGDSVGECIRKIIFLASIVAIVVCGYLVCSYYYDRWASKHKNNEIMGIYEIYEDRPVSVEKVEEEGEIRKRYTSMLDGARKLYDLNNEIVGVISIPDTPVNNPVLQAEDNQKYMKIKYDLSDNVAGEIFLDYRAHFDEVGEDGYLKVPNSDNLVIYGHNMLDEQMFGSLKYYAWRENYYGEHPLIYLNSNYEKYTYKIFAFFILDAEDETDTKFDCWNTLDFADEHEFYSYVNEAKRRSIRLNNVDVKYGDPLITLFTCNTSLPDDERGRLIIMARLVREGEDPLAGTQDSVANTNIKWPTIYYEKHPNEKYDPNQEFTPYGN